MEDVALKKETDELKNYVHRGNCVAFIGSGLSMGAYIGWEELISKLCAACGVEVAPNEKDLLELAQRAKNTSPENYHRVLSEEFGKDISSMPIGYTHLVQASFSAYVTINFDPLLAEASRYLGVTIYDFKGGLNSSRLEDKAIFYIHGYVEPGSAVQNGDLILSGDDFDRCYEQGGSTIPSFLEQLLSFHPVVFIGCRLKEPELKRIIDLCNKLKNGFEQVAQASGPLHYILLPRLYTKVSGEVKTRDESKEAEENEDYERVGIRVIRYKRSSATDHSAVTKILEDWSQAPKIKPVSPYDEGPEL